MFDIYRILIVDDNYLTKELLMSCLPKTNIKISVLRAIDLADAYIYISNFNIDFFIINIFDDFLLSFRFAYTIRQKEKYAFTPIAFISSQIDYIIIAFKELNCCDYILKPLTTESFKRVSEILKNNLTLFSKTSNVQEKCLCFNTSHEYLKIPVDDIYFIEASNRKSIIHTISGCKTVPLSMSKILSLPQSKELIQTHRSFVVNFDNVCKIIKTYEPWTIHFGEYDKTALVSRGFKNKVIKKLAQ